MSFNLIYADKGIDFSGFAEGVANGMKMRFEQEKYERKLFDDEMKQFRLTLKPDKLKPGDKAEYINSMDEYTKARKNELRLDKKWRVKPEDRQLAYEASEKAKAKVGELYSNSQKANEWMKNADDALATYEKQKIVPPTALLQLYTQVRDTPSSKIDWKTIQAPTSFDVMPSADEMSKHMTALTDAKLYDQEERVVDPTRPKQTIPDSVPYLKGLGTTYYKVNKFMSPQQAYVTAKNTTDGNSLANKKNANFNDFTRALNSEPTSKIRIDADKTAEEIAAKAGIAVKDIDANHLWAYNMGLYNKKFAKSEDDNTEVKNALIGLAAMNDAEKMKIQKALAHSQMATNAANSELVKVQKLASLLSSSNIVSMIRNSATDSELYQLAGDYGIDLPNFANDVEAYQKSGKLGNFDILKGMLPPKKQ